MKRFFFIFVFSLLSFNSLPSWSSVVRVEIAQNQKNVVLFAGALYQFDCQVWNDDGNLVQAALDWRIKDLDGFETTIPGRLNQNGLLEVSGHYAGTFRVVVTEVSSGLTDEALVQIQSPFPYEISRIEIFPSSLSVWRGSSTYLSIRCFDTFGQEVRHFTLRYYLRDMWGRVVPDPYVDIQRPGLLQVSPYALGGRYTLYFEDIHGSAATFINIDIL